MNTRILDVSNLNEEVLRQAQVLAEPEAISNIENALEKVEFAGEIIKTGGLVAFPTETVYGLGANAFDEEAVKKVYAAKGRPSDNPMIVHIARASDIGALTNVITPNIVKLADNFWPGPLTMILKKKENVPSTTTGGLNTVAVRLPDNPIAIELIRAAGTPIAAPSANISGSPSPTKAEHVIRDLDGKIEIILAGQDSRIGIESTVIDMTSEIPTILRPGIITADHISAALDTKVIYDPSLVLAENIDVSEPRSPGMKYKHYAPRAEMLVIEGNKDKVKSEIERLKHLNEEMGSKVGVILFEEQSYIEAAHDFYSRLRDLDDEGVDLILAGALSQKDGVGFAVMNRMMKSAGYRIVLV